MAFSSAPIRWKPSRHTFVNVSILRAINSAVVDLSGMFLWPGQDRRDPPVWVRAAFGWGIIALFIAGFTLLR